jgi:hypothetical protein
MKKKLQKSVMVKNERKRNVPEEFWGIRLNECLYCIREVRDKQNNIGLTLYLAYLLFNLNK